MHTIRMTLWIWFNPSVNLGKTYVLELLWTVYSEEKLQSFLELTNFQNHFNKDKSVVKKTKAGPGYDEIPLKLWKSSKLKFLENHFNKDKLVGL